MSLNDASVEAELRQARRQVLGWLECKHGTPAYLCVQPVSCKGKGNSFLSTTRDRGTVRDVLLEFSARKWKLEVVHPLSRERRLVTLEDPAEMANFEIQAVTPVCEEIDGAKTLILRINVRKK